MSKVKKLIEDMKHASETVPKYPDHRMTLRLTGLQYEALLLLAGEVQHSPTGVAEDLLAEALEEGLEALGYASFQAAIPDLVIQREHNKKRMAELQGGSQREPDAEERALIMDDMRQGAK